MAKKKPKNSNNLINFKYWLRASRYKDLENAGEMPHLIIIKPTGLLSVSDGCPGNVAVPSQGGQGVVLP